MQISEIMEIANKETKFDATSLETMISDYRLALKGEATSSLSPEQMLDKIIDYGLGINVGVKVLKIVLGMIFSTIKSTTDNITYGVIVERRFQLTTQTANRYALIYDAIYSGQFLYTLPDKYNPLILSMRDMETLAELIVEGELSTERAHMIFSDGDWLTKRDAVRDDVPEIVKRNGSRDKKRREKKTVRKFRWRKNSGDLFYGPGFPIANRFGVLFIDDPNPEIRAIAQRALSILRQEIKDREAVQ